MLLVANCGLHHRWNLLSYYSSWLMVQLPVRCGLTFQNRSLELDFGLLSNIFLCPCVPTLFYIYMDIMCKSILISQHNFYIAYNQTVHYTSSILQFSLKTYLSVNATQKCSWFTNMDFTSFFPDMLCLCSPLCWMWYVPMIQWATASHTTTCCLLTTGSSW